MAEPVYEKRCPACGQSNAPWDIACGRDGCSTVLLAVAAVPAADGAEVEAAAAGVPGPGTLRVPEWVRPAACVLVPRQEPGLRFRVLDGQTVGRTDRADVVLAGVADLPYISSVHARFFRRGAQWYVQHVGGTNFIEVDGQRHGDSAEVAVHPDSVVSLALTPFQVVLEAD